MLHPSSFPSINLNRKEVFAMYNSTWDFRSNRQKYENMLRPGSINSPKGIGINTFKQAAQAARKEGKGPKMVI